jgi:DNA replication protein DnaC
MYTRENYALAKAEIEKRRLDAISTAEERNRDLALESEEIRVIDRELSGTGLLLFKTACMGGDIEPIRKRNTELNAKRKQILVKLGYPEDYTDVHYTCKVCSDTGFVGTKMCSCLKQLLITKNIQSSGMGNLIDKQSFENFNLDVFNHNPEIREKMQRNLRIAKAFADNFASHHNNLLLIGTTGTGKTHVSTAIAKTVITQGFDVLYDSAQNIIDDFETDKFKSGYNRGESLSEKYLECELLIIDDLGAEFVTQFSVSALYNLINTRQNKGLSTIISTNLSASELAGKYDGRIYSRIIGADYTVLRFEGNDYRIMR